MDALHTIDDEKVVHFDAHALYGLKMAQATKKAVDHIYSSKRSWLVSRSNFIGMGQYGGHWSGDNYATWEQHSSSLNALLDMNMFGIPYTGADLCGFLDDTTEELCTSWTVLGIIYPFMRNHNAWGMKNQDPASFSEQHQRIVKNALKLRYSLLPELHNAFYISHTKGGTVVKSVMEVHPGAKMTQKSTPQVYWGDSVAFAPQEHKTINKTWTSVFEVPPGESYFNIQSGAFHEGHPEIKTGHTVLRDIDDETTLIDTLMRVNKPIFSFGINF